MVENILIFFANNFFFTKIKSEFTFRPLNNKTKTEPKNSLI